MTKKEMENRILNLELAISALASKTYNRDSKVEESVGVVETKADELGYSINEMTLAEADVLVDICCLQLGVEKSDLMAEESEEEE